MGHANQVATHYFITLLGASELVYLIISCIVVACKIEVVEVVIVVVIVVVVVPLVAVDVADNVGAQSDG